MNLRDEESTQQNIQAVGMSQCAADCCCAPADFTRSENLVVPMTYSPKMRRDLRDSLVLNAISWGANAVFCVDSQFLTQVEGIIRGADPNWVCFGTEYTALLNACFQQANCAPVRLASCFLPDLVTTYGPEPTPVYIVRILGPQGLAPYYPAGTWEHALCAKRQELDMLGVGAFDDGQLIGLAACSADGDELWQIGVDVDPRYRGRGLATALVNRLAREIFARGKIPFYSAAWSNICSVKTAAASGFRPAWVQMTVHRA